MKKIKILKDAEMNFYCEDYGDRKGCGCEIKLIKTTRGRTVACNPVQECVFDREGNAHFMFVPHFISCPESTDYHISQLQEKAEKDAEWRANNPRRDSSSGSGPRRAAY